MTQATEPTESYPQVLTTRQAAAALQISEDTLRRWLREGTIGGSWISDRAGWRIPVSEINRVLTSGGPRAIPLGAPEGRRATPTGVSARKQA